MNKLKIILFFTIGILACENETQHTTMNFLTKEIPNDIPIEFMPHLVSQDKLIHKGMLSPDLKEYYYTISDKNFDNFEVYVIRKENKSWSEPEKAFFNSNYNEHGMSFSPKGNTLYFSSTRPVDMEGVPPTWHLWKSEKVDGEWKNPVFVDIPNLRNKLVSHPTITNSGTLYFHTSNLDYTDMQIHHSKQVNGAFVDAEKTSIPMTSNTQQCTPYVSPDEDYLIFASIGDQLDLMITFNDGMGKWSKPKKLNPQINDFGQGNPYVTPDNKFLFFTTGEHKKKTWKVKWVNIATEITNHQHPE